jgi:flagellar protein FliL
MATKETPPPPPAPAAVEPPKKRGKLLIIIGAAIVLVIGVATAAVFLLMPAPADDDEIAAEDKPKKKKKDEKTHAAPPAYLNLDPFVVNLTSEAGEQYLQAAMTLEFEEGKQADHAKVYMPKIRNQVMLLLSGKKPAELASKEGKEKLASEIRKEINTVLLPEESNGKEIKAPLKAVLFTSFIIQ